MIEGSGSIPLTNESGSGSMRPKNMWIRWIRSRIRNTASEDPKHGYLRCQTEYYGTYSSQSRAVLSSFVDDGAPHSVQERRGEGAGSSLHCQVSASSQHPRIFRPLSCRSRGKGRSVNFRLIRSSRVIRASDCQCRSLNSPGFDPSILRHIGIWGAADEAEYSTFKKSFPVNFWQ